MMDPITCGKIRQVEVKDNINSYQSQIDLLMDIITPYCHILGEYLDRGIKATEACFNQHIEKVDFTAFCIIYAILLIWILRRLHRSAIFRPKNIEVIGLRERISKGISTFFVNLPGIKQYVHYKFVKALEKNEEEILKDFNKDKDPLKARKIPNQGMKQSNIKDRIQRWSQTQDKGLFSGRVSGTIYVESIQHCKQVNEFAAKYMYHNPLHLDTYKEVSKMEAQVLKMTSNLISKERTYGVVTSGGSESLIMSLYAYKNFANKKRPNVVVPNTIHASIDKGAKYFNIEVRKARLNDKYQADVKHMESLIDSNTIALYGSYPNYPHGIIDPIAQIAKIAKKRNIPFHIDGCLGGLIVTFLKDHENKFTLDLDGATSISLDHHKFGLAPKGISTIFFKTKQLRHHMYYIYTDWVGGIYATPSFPGSRSGFASAGAWYALTRVGRKQYLENALLITKSTVNAAKKLSEIEGVKIIGNPQVCVLAFQIQTVDPFTVSSYLQKTKHWHISSLHIPRALHVSVTLGNCHNVEKNLANDVRQAIEYLKDHPQPKTTTAAVYGASASMPSYAMGEQMIRTIIGLTYNT